MWNTCAAKLCFIKQHPDANQNFLVRWVLPYPKDIRCSCTYFHLHPCAGKHHISIVKASDHFFTDEPLLFMNNRNQENLQKLLGCDKDTGKLLNIFCYRNFVEFQGNNIVLGVHLGRE